jgi:phytoene synthase
MADAFDHCEEQVRSGDKDRFLATLFAPQKYRRALHALYAFNLEVARTRELSREPMPGEIRLQWWRDVLAGASVEGSPVATALREVVVRYRLPPRLLETLIDARAFDLYNEPMASVGDLDNYAVGTSSVLIELASRILNDGKETGAGDLSGHAGIAFAITGLLRALPLHAARGQVYLPADVLARHRAQTDDLLGGRATTELRAALGEMRLHARGNLDAARELLAAAPETISPALLPVALVRPLLDRMERRLYQPFRPRDLPQWRRQWVLCRAARRGLSTAF